MKLPDLEDLLALRGDSRSLQLRARGPARALLLGSHRGAHRGRGLEFEEVRPYAPGDDVRSIDWRVTARRGRVHTKLFREERERPVWLLVDLQPGMFFGSRVQLKSAMAVRAAALLSWTAVAGGDRVGAVIRNGAEMRCLPPRTREAGVLPVLNELLALQPCSPAMPDTDNLREALRLLRPLVHPGSLVLALSDFAAASSTDQPLWSALSAHAECRLFWITDRLEREGLPDGRYRGGLPRRLAALDGAASRASWLAAWREREARVVALSQQLRLELTRLDTGIPVERALQPSVREAPFAA
ncbi:MAG: DUF58 domain-containing protein [Steroidobacterales bacterium]